MTNIVLYAIGAAVVALWVRAERNVSLRRLLLYWWAGLLLTRLGPTAIGLASGSWASEPSSMRLATAVEWIGAAIFLRAILGLSLWGRSFATRWTKIAGAAFILGFLLSGLFGRSPGWLVLAFPWLASFRWRRNLGSLGLFVASVTGLISLVLCLVVWNRPGLEQDGVRGLSSFGLSAGLLGLFYSLLGTPAAASRLHLSIKRIGARLLGSHLLAGLVPLALAMIFILLTGALFLSTYRGSIAARMLESRSEKARESLTRMLERDDLERISAFGPDIPGQRIVLRAAGATRALGPALPFAPDSLLAVEASSSDYPLLFDGRTIFLRARIDTVLEGQRIRAEALAPIDSLWMSGVSEIVGARIRLSPQVTVMREGGGVRISEEDDAKTTRPERGRSVGPRETDSSRLPGGAIIPALRLAGDGFRLSSIPVTSSADFTEPLLALIPIARENPIATMALIVLGLLAVLLLGAIWVTVVMVIGMARSITGAVRALTDGTQALRAGHFEHRIPIDGNDELWAVARSFNEMAEDLEKSRDIERESQRLEEELRLARLIQNRLLPSGPPDLERVELAGISMPAREVGGDYFDYLVLDNGLVGIAVADVSGKGAPAALLMSSFRASLRTQDLAGLGPAEVLARLNRFIHQSVDPGKFITAFLGLLDPATGRIRYANAGHDPPLVRKTTGEIVEMTGGGLILGMLPQIVYEEGEATLERGSLLAVFTDGVTEARNVDGDFFGSDRLAEFLRLADGTPCSDILQGIVERVQDFSEGTPQADDITIVLMRPR